MALEAQNGVMQDPHSSKKEGFGSATLGKIP